jgi:hypothetical protein
MPHESSLWGAGLGLALVLAVGAFIMSPFGLVAYTYVNSDDQERLIAVQNTVLNNPPNYEGTKIQFEWHYTKSEHMVRVVITTPEGYDGDAGFNIDTHSYLTRKRFCPSGRASPTTARIWPTMTRYRAGSLPRSVSTFGTT